MDGEMINFSRHCYLVVLNYEFDLFFWFFFFFTGSN